MKLAAWSDAASLKGAGWAAKVERDSKRNNAAEWWIAFINSFQFKAGFVRLRGKVPVQSKMRDTEYPWENHPGNRWYSSDDRDVRLTTKECKKK